MTNAERDKMIRETHTAVTLVVSKVGDLAQTVYGNGQPGLKDRVKSLEVKQDECPARIAHQRDNKMFVVAVCSMLVAAGSLAWMIVGN